MVIRQGWVCNLGLQACWGNNLETRVLLGCNLETVARLRFCWCVNVKVSSAFTCGRLSWHGCSDRPQVRPPRGESSPCHSPLIVVIQSLPILRREHREERKKSIYFKFYTQLQDTYWKRKLSSLSKLHFQGISPLIALSNVKYFSRLAKLVNSPTYAPENRAGHRIPVTKF